MNGVWKIFFVVDFICFKWMSFFDCVVTLFLCIPLFSFKSCVYRSCLLLSLLEYIVSLVSFMASVCLILFASDLS